MLRRLAVALAFAVLLTASVAPAAEVETSPLEVVSEAMLPTLPIGGWLDVDYRAYDRARPARGDVVVAHPPRSYGNHGEPMRCGVRVRRGQMCARGHVFLLGDNRDHWDDSRVWGAVPTRAAVARVTACTPPRGETCGPLG